MAILTGKDREHMAKNVVRLRDHDKLSWRAIGQSFDPQFAPRTARSLYDLVKGEGSHHHLLEGKGGRTPVVKEETPAPEPKATPTPRKRAASPKPAPKATAKSTPKASPAKATRRPVKAAAKAA